MNLLFFIHSYKNPLSILGSVEMDQFENLGELVKNTIFGT
jgi:hypothetical protein